MLEIPILMPQLGESIAEATIVKLNIAEGDTVEAYQEVIEGETNMACMEVTEPLSVDVMRSCKAPISDAIVGW